MTVDTYKIALKRAKGDLSHAIKQRDYWTIEIGRLQQLVKSLSASVEKKPYAKTDNKKTLSLNALVGVRFTDMILSIVSSVEGGVVASDVKRILEDKGYDLSEYSNPSALIHQTLKRLHKDGRIVRTKDGKYERAILDDFLIDILRDTARHREQN
jgi:hypothetical protein